MNVGRWWPTRAAGLPRGQRLLPALPRFSDQPSRPPPTVAADAALEIAINGRVIASIAASELANHRHAQERVHDFHCVTGWSVRELRWRGVPLRTLLGDHADVDRLPAFATARAHDGVQAIFRTDDLLDSQTSVTTHLDGRPLDARTGAPVRLVTPHLYGYKNIKHVRAIEFLGDEPMSTFGAKEHLRARVAHEERHSRLPNWLVRIPYRVAIPVTAHLAERALERNVSPSRRESAS